MIRHDLAHWPLVVTIAYGVMTRDEHAAFLADWTCWLDRRERFATLRLFADSAALSHPDGAARDAKAWLQTNSERIRAQVFGMATIVPAQELERVSRMNAEKLFGVSAQSFGNVDEAMTWIVETVLWPNGVVVDRDAVRAGLIAATGLARP
jgi:hypothetical protein